MNSLDMFLIQYGLVAIFMIMLIKTIGIHSQREGIETP